MSDLYSSTKNLNNRMAFWILLAAVYLIIRFVFTNWLDSFGPYASYWLEVIDVCIAWFLAGSNFFNYFTVDRKILFCSLGSLFVGFAIFRITGFAEIQIPFDLKGTETLVFLLLVAPFLEELIFRFFIWQPIEWLTGKPIIAWLITSLMFSYSHLHSIWFLPKEIHSFVVYQTIYTLILGLACGFFKFRNNSIAGAVLVHFGFNLGFYLGSFT